MMDVHCTNRMTIVMISNEGCSISSIIDMESTFSFAFGFASGVNYRTRLLYPLFVSRNIFNSYYNIVTCPMCILLNLLTLELYHAMHQS